MAITKIEDVRNPLAEAAYARIAEGILTDELSPGARLVMDELAEQLGISRTPVRQALQRLQMERVIEPHGRRGYVVRRLSELELDEQYMARTAIEPFALAEVARRGGQALAYFSDVFEAQCAAPQRTAIEVFAANKQIHRGAVEALNNSYLLSMFDTVWQAGIAGRVWADILDAGDAANFAELHRPILAAARSGDPAEARRVAEAHIWEGRALHPRHS